MIQFLLNIFEALASFAMLSLGLSFTTQVENCAVQVELVPAEYFVIDYALESEAHGCATSSNGEAEPVEVFRI